MLKFLLPLALTFAACASTQKAPAATPYKLNTCVVMDSKLGSMGDPVVRVYNGQEVKFCCLPCVEEFEAEPDFYLAKMKQELMEQKGK